MDLIPICVYYCGAVEFYVNSVLNGCRCRLCILCDSRL